MLKNGNITARIMEEKMYDTKEEAQKVILVGIEDGETQIENSIKELGALADTAGARVLDTLTQKREKRHPGHYIGKGKLEELKDLISLHDADGIVCDDELSPAQQRNLSDMLNTSVMDRTLLILDIFAQHAQSSEGKVQVELAQLKYRLSHLAGMGKVLSRLGGGIGTRGPGEKKLETDRRHIRNRIKELNEQLTEIERHRRLLREQRNRNPIPVVSLVGYTNAGKSTLLNALTGAGVLAEDKLFATLDTTTRQKELPGGGNIMLTDTVGFIQKLPHHLIQAFRATLEELKYADILIHVVDASSQDRESQMKVVYETLDKLDCGQKPVITVFNKTDKPVELPLPSDPRARMVLSLSAETGHKLDELLIETENVLKTFRQKVYILVPYSDGKLRNEIYESCEIITEEHRTDGVYMEISCNEIMINKSKKYQL